MTPTVPDAAPLREELRLGSVAGGGADEFGQVMALEADELGRIYIADGLSNEIRVFTPDGRHLRTLGGQGSGPGEFRMLTGMAGGMDGRLSAMDPIASRLTVFDTAGTLVGTYSREFTLGTTIPWAGVVDPQGHVYDWTHETPGTGSSAGPRQFLLRHRLEGRRLVPDDTLFLPRTTPTDTFQTHTPDGLRLVGDVPFSSSRRWRLAPDGSIWIGMTGDYRLDRLGFDGDTVATLQRPWEPVAVSPAERDSVVAEDGVPADRVPETKPAFRSFFVASDGRVWVEPHLPDDGGTAWDVFSDAGAYLGRVRTALELETEVPSPVVRGDRLYAVLRDELDVPYVVRLRIPELPASES